MASDGIVGMEGHSDRVNFRLGFPATCTTSQPVRPERIAPSWSFVNYLRLFTLLPLFLNKAVEIKSLSVVFFYFNYY